METGRIQKKGNRTMEKNSNKGRGGHRQRTGRRFGGAKAGMSIPVIDIKLLHISGFSACTNMAMLF